MRQNGLRGLRWPLLLSGLGVVWLAHALGALPAGWPDRLGRLWPAILVVMGLDMLLGRRSPGRVAAVLLAGALLVAAALTWMQVRGLP
jgi:hypothetical protein